MCFSIPVKVFAPNLTCEPPLPSQRMYEWRSNCNFFAYKLNKELRNGFSELPGSEATLIRYYTEQLSRGMPDLCRRLNISTEKPNEVTCKARSLITVDGDHELIMSLQNMVEVSYADPSTLSSRRRSDQQDPQGEHLTWVSLRGHRGGDGWDAAIDVSTANSDAGASGYSPEGATQMSLSRAGCPPESSMAGHGE